MTLKFLSDGSVTAGGFQIKYTTLDSPAKPGDSRNTTAQGKNNFLAGKFGIMWAELSEHHNFFFFLSLSEFFFLFGFSCVLLINFARGINYKMWVNRELFLEHKYCKNLKNSLLPKILKKLFFYINSSISSFLAPLEPTFCATVAIIFKPNSLFSPHFHIFIFFKPLLLFSTRYSLF